MGEVTQGKSKIKAVFVTVYQGFIMGLTSSLFEPSLADKAQVHSKYRCDVKGRRRSSETLITEMRERGTTSTALIANNYNQKKITLRIYHQGIQKVAIPAQGFHDDLTSWVWHLVAAMVGTAALRGVLLVAIGVLSYWVCGCEVNTGCVVTVLLVVLATL